MKGIPLKLVRQRVRVFKASPSEKMTARIRVNRGNLPAIKAEQPSTTGGVLDETGQCAEWENIFFRGVHLFSNWRMAAGMF